MVRRRFILGTLLVAAATLLAAAPSSAQEGRHSPRAAANWQQPWSGPDFLIAREQNQDQRPGGDSVRLVPLSSVLADIRGRYPGKLLDARTVGSGAGTRYEIRWLTPDSRRLDITASAMTGDILSVRGP